MRGSFFLLVFLSSSDRREESEGTTTRTPEKTRNKTKSRQAG